MAVIAVRRRYNSLLSLNLDGFGVLFHAERAVNRYRTLGGGDRSFELQSRLATGASTLPLPSCPADRLPAYIYSPDVSPQPQLVASCDAVLPSSVSAPGFDSFFPRILPSRLLTLIVRLEGAQAWEKVTTRADTTPRCWVFQPTQDQAMARVQPYAG